MNCTMKMAVDLLFSTLPFSFENERCREKIILIATQKYEEEIERGIHPAKSAGDFLIHSDSIEHISDYLGIEPPSYDLSDTTEIRDKNEFGKVQKKLRRNMYLLSLLITVCLNAFVAFCLNFSVLGFGIAALEWAVAGSLIYVTWKRRKKIVGRYDFFHSVFEYRCRKTAEKKYDFYTKKFTNTLFGVFSLGFILLLSVLLAFTSFRYTASEVANTVNFYLTPLFLLTYLALKNFLCRKLYADFFCQGKSTEYFHELRRISICSAGYYLFCIAVLFYLRNKTDSVFSLGIAAVASYIIFAVFYNCTRRRGYMSRNLIFNLRKVLCYTLVIVCLCTYYFMKFDFYLLQPYINTVSAVGNVRNDIFYDEDTGVYTIVSENDNFKILQLTDIHLGGSVLSVREDTKAMKACYRLIQETAPDFVIVTGDLVFPMGIMSFSLNNNAPIMQFANFMRNVGIPWAFTYGNHDTESLATLNREEVDELFKSLSYKTSRNLLYPYVQPDIYGRSNQMIEVKNKDGSMRQALFLIDSNDYIESGGINEYDYIHDDQVEWYERMLDKMEEQEGRIVPSMIFTHIPLREYKEANDLYENGSSEVIYYYGILGETMIDKICCSKYESGLFDAAVESGSTKAFFFGHDHYNNQSLEYKGIRMTYGYSIDYLAMPGIENDTEQRGATLITLKEDGNYEITPYRLIDME